MHKYIQEYMVSAQYFAPRGKERLMFLGEHISHRYLNWDDLLIAVVGDAGAGKSSLIKGMFPGLQLSNDDDIVNPRKIIQMQSSFLEIEDATTFHIDVRFQMAFTQMYKIVEHVENLLIRKRRVVIEHFDLIYKGLGKNADILVGIGEEIIITRPSVFGPRPESIYKIVYNSLRYRKMAHSAEELAIIILTKKYEIPQEEFFFSEIRNGFVINLKKKPDIDLNEMAVMMDEMIAKNMDISYYDENHIKLGEEVLKCDGPRFHVGNTSEIENFMLVRELIYDPITGSWCLIGLVDDDRGDIMNRNTHYFLTRESLNSEST